MGIILKVIIYWDIAMWVMGAVFTTALLIIGLMWAYSTLLNGWGKKVRGDFLFHLWIYQAMRAWIREGNPRPDGHPLMTERQKLETCARELIDFAEEHGYVLTISTEPQPLQPLAMGNHYMALQVRPARNRYQEGGTQ